jgi:hypothetical protein
VDGLGRRRRPLLIALGVALAACAAAGGGEPVGVSAKSAAPRAARDAGGGDAAGAAASLPTGYRASFAKVNKARFASRGHAPGRWDVDVWANEAAQEALATRAREVPAGAVVIQEHYERGGDGAPTPAAIMMMEKMPAGYSKEHGDWRWAAYGSRGQLVRQGVLESCAGCHDDAPMDGLFPIVGE